MVNDYDTGADRLDRMTAEDYYNERKGKLESDDFVPYKDLSESEQERYEKELEENRQSLKGSLELKFQREAIYVDLEKEQGNFLRILNTAIDNVERIRSDLDDELMLVENEQKVAENKYQRNKANLEKRIREASGNPEEMERLNAELSTLNNEYSESIRGFARRKKLYEAARDLCNTFANELQNIKNNNDGLETSYTESLETIGVFSKNLSALRKVNVEDEKSVENVVKAINKITGKVDAIHARTISLM